MFRIFTDTKLFESDGRLDSSKFWGISIRETIRANRKIGCIMFKCKINPNTLEVDDFHFMTFVPKCSIQPNVVKHLTVANFISYIYNITSHTLIMNNIEHATCESVMRNIKCDAGELVIISV
jgi:hypothetical protein